MDRSHRQYLAFFSQAWSFFSFRPWTSIFLVGPSPRTTDTSPSKLQTRSNQSWQTAQVPGCRYWVLRIRTECMIKYLYRATGDD